MENYTNRNNINQEDYHERTEVLERILNDVRKGDLAYEGTTEKELKNYMKSKGLNEISDIEVPNKNSEDLLDKCQDYVLGRILYAVEREDEEEKMKYLEEYIEIDRKCALLEILNPQSDVNVMRKLLRNMPTKEAAQLEYLRRKGYIRRNK